MKNLYIYTFIGIFAPLSVFAESQAVGGQWKGLNNGDSSVFIPDNEAQDLLNVDITDGGFGIKKREGYADFKTLTYTTSPVRGGYYFQDVSGNNLLIHAHNRIVAKSANGGTYTAFVTTATRDSYWDFTDSQGKLFGLNSSNDELWSYDGTSLVYYPSAPKGNQIENTSDRMAISGVTANPNRVYFSGLADFTNFVTGTEETDPFTEDFGLPGQDITAIKWAGGRLLVWTKNTLSFWEGSNQFDGVIEDVSTTLGCNQPSSIVYDYGLVYWQAQDGHFYVYDFNTITKLSEKIAGSVAGFGGVADYSSWVTSSQAEFTAGSGLSGSSGLTATFSPGDLSYQPNISQEVISGQASFDSDSLAQSVAPVDTFILTYGRFSFSNASGGVVSSTITIRTDSSGSPSETILSTANISIPISGLYLTATFSPPVTLTANTTYWVFFTTFTSPANVGVFISVTNTYPYGRLLSNANRDLNFWLGSSTATYTAAAFNVGVSVSAWGSFETNHTLNSGSIDYEFYGCATSSCNRTTFTSSQTITSGQIPSVAVAPYATWAAKLSRTSPVFTPSISDVTLYWYEGAQARNWGHIDDQHRLVWSVAEGTHTLPNVSYIFDQRFGSWLKYSFPFEAPARVGRYTYFGDVDEGYVYRWPSTNSDDGNSITAYWKSKDFISGEPYIEKDYDALSIIAKTQTGSNLDITYTINTSTSIAYNISLTDANGNSFIRNNAFLPHGKFGTFFNFKFGNDDADAPFEVYTVKYDYKPRPWRVLP